MSGPGEVEGLGIELSPDLSPASGVRELHPLRVCFCRAIFDGSNLHPQKTPHPGGAGIILYRGSPSIYVWLLSSRVSPRFRLCSPRFLHCRR
jgi:hypothetical protein